MGLGQKFLAQLVKSDGGWKMVKSVLVGPAAYAARKRQARQMKKRSPAYQELVTALCQSGTVQHGPFKGLRYPQAVSFGSNLMPKLLGSYEQELHPLFTDILARPYEQIIDVGCAEGYYAIGLARCLPHTTVYAFDIEAQARDLTMEMAHANGVAERVKIGACADEKSLSEIDLSKRTLLISDCEGGEAALFTPQLVARLGNTDTLIELHEMYVDNVAQQMTDLFAATHRAQYIDSIDDMRKARRYTYPELDGLLLQDRYAILAETRGAIMEWAFFEPARNTAS